VYALVAGRNVETLAQQIVEFRPQVAAVATPEALVRLTELLAASALPRAEWPELMAGADARIQVSIAAEVDTVISAIPTNFTATALMPFTNLLLATFTNGVPNSATNNFTVFINWGDNSTNGGLILNGGFETGSLTNWTLVNSTYGRFVVNNGTVIPPGAGG